MMHRSILLVTFQILSTVASPIPDVPHGPAPQGCSKYELIIARGTSEPGPFGSIVGDPLVKGVTSALPGSRGYAVQYPATIDLKASAGKGMDDVINRLNKQVKLCPEQIFSLIGYSQGAGVIHGIFEYENRTYPGVKGVVPKLDTASVLPKVSSIVTFGDPGFRGDYKLVHRIPEELQSKLKINCAHADPNCDAEKGSFSNHLKYRGNPWQKESAAFIVAGFKGTPLPYAVKDINDPKWKSYP